MQYLSKANLHALEDRKYYLETFLSRLEWSAATPHVLSLGSEPAKELSEYLEAYGFSRLQIDNVEASHNATQHKAGQDANFWTQLHCLPRAKYHLIWLADGFGGLDACSFKRILPRLLKALAPGGELMIGSSSTPKHKRSRIGFTGASCLAQGEKLQWQMLAREWGTNEQAMTVRCEPVGTNFFIHIKLN